MATGRRYLCRCCFFYLHVRCLVPFAGSPYHFRVPLSQPLRETEKLESSMNPAVTAVRGWFGGVVVKVDPDGNCYGTSWVIAALLWAVQRPERILKVERFFKAAMDAGAFSALDDDCQVEFNGSRDIFSGS